MKCLTNSSSVISGISRLCSAYAFGLLLCWPLGCALQRYLDVPCCQTHFKMLWRGTGLERQRVLGYMMSQGRVNRKMFLVSPFTVTGLGIIEKSTKMLLLLSFLHAYKLAKKKIFLKVYLV